MLCLWYSFVLPVVVLTFTDLYFVSSSAYVNMNVYFHCEYLSFIWFKNYNQFLDLRFLLKAVTGLCLLLELDAAWILICNMGGGFFFPPQVKLCSHFYLFDITSFLIPFPALGISYYFLLKFWPFRAFLFGTKFSRWIILVSLRGNWSKGSSWVLSMGKRNQQKKKKKSTAVFHSVFVSALIS